MKIGEFAHINHTTIDTIRHYMDMSLLTPEKKGTFYEFDKSDQNDYETIIKFKNIGFTLSEIQTLLLFEKIGRHTGYTRRTTYKAFYENKLQWIDDEIHRLEEMKKWLQKSISDIQNEPKTKSNPTGVPLGALSIFYCNDCESKYGLEEGKIQNDKVISGKLTCLCHKQLEIKEGIVYGMESLEVNKSPKVDDSFIEDYITTTHVDYLKKLQLTVQWDRKNFSDFSKQNKLILELGSGRGFFLRNVLDLLPEDSYYVAVDHNPNAHYWLSKAMEGVEGSDRIIYLCCDFKHIPLKNQTLDILIDVTGSSNYAFDNPDFLLDSITPLLKNKAKIFGHYIMFNNFKMNTLIPEASRKWFTKESMIEAFLELGFMLVKDYKTPIISEGGPKESFFIPGEKIYYYLLIGEYII